VLVPVLRRGEASEETWDCAAKQDTESFESNFSKEVKLIKPASRYDIP
jgi:hypothetical protein